MHRLEAKMVSELMHGFKVAMLPHMKKFMTGLLWSGTYSNTGGRRFGAGVAGGGVGDSLMAQWVDEWRAGKEEEKRALEEAERKVGGAVVVPGLGVRGPVTHCCVCVLTCASLMCAWYLSRS